MERIRTQVLHIIQENHESPKVFIRWAALACMIGVVVGLFGAGFHHVDEWASNTFYANPQLVYGMPFVGLLIVFLYRRTDMADDRGTNLILVSMRDNKRVRLRLTPLIAISTTLTHLVGGSAGREGAALQMGASLSDYIGRVLKLEGDDTRTIKICGMAAGFAALFGTPLAAAIFAIEVARVGTMYYTALFASMLSALVASIVAGYFGGHAAAFTILDAPLENTFLLLWQVALLGLFCALIAVLFCWSFSAAHKLYRFYTPNPYLMAFCGGVIIIGLTGLLGVTDFNGAGMATIERAMQGDADPLSFAFKILFTVATLTAGFKGGEIVPSLCIGATFGCAYAALFGLSPSFCAALAMISVFCAVTNCPMASVFMAYELFGGQCLPLFMLCCGVSYTMSGDGGLYAAQHIIYHKFKFERIPKRAQKTDGHG